MGTDSAPGGRGAAAPAMGNFQLEDFAAGWIGGAASVIVGHPLDTVKTRLQAGIGYGNTLSCIRTVYRRESVFGFFKGMSFPLASIAVYNSVVFGVFSNTQRFLSWQHCREPGASPSRTLSDLLLASMVAGVVSVGLGAPVDLIKIRLQMQTQPFQEGNLSLKPRAVALGEQPAYQGPVHCITTIVRTEGLAGLYRGAGAMLLRDVPGYCLYFIPYVLLSEWITPEACAAPSPCAVWLAGGMAGAISWGTATPMDVVKSRLQADGVYLNKYKGVLDCIAQSYQKEGLKVSPTAVTRGQCQSLEGVFQRHHRERCAGLPHERGHVPWVRALAAGNPRGPRGDRPLSTRAIVT
ncbi:solute carrier family 25 member 48 isoform X1 [Equus asinus]|uniref:solute carrier family 25 member 48 isoform X1 n=1 Tax=Equus asinus TaxID=9793 RepID=UPI0038F71634